MKKLWMSWSTGKDSAYALLDLQKNPAYEVVGLFTTVTKEYDRVAMHSSRIVLLERQAQMLGLPLEIVTIPAQCSNEIYETKMRKLTVKALAAGVSVMAFGDLYLEDIRKYRERLLANTGIECVFPLWQRPTKELAQEMIDVGIEAVLTCIDSTKLSHSFAGRYFNAQTLQDFPASVDPCGENGEFHTFVFSSPGFQRPIPIEVGERLQREEFIYSDVILADEPAGN